MGRAGGPVGSAASVLRWLLLLQLAAAGALGVAAHRWFGAGALAAAATGLGAVLLVRLLITANNFFLSWRFGSATPPAHALGPAARLRLFADEFSATLLHSSWIMPRARAQTHLYPFSPLPPVLLLHGYGCNSGYWAHLVPLLDARRISYASLDLEPMLADIDDYVPMVADAIDALRADTGSARVVIVAHSMGGLVARAYMRRDGADAVARVITLGTPHHGTGLARFGPGRNAAQMRRGDPAQPQGGWLQRLAQEETPAMRARVTSIFTHHDNIVAPQTSCVLPGARNVEFGGVGHVAMGRHPRILARVLEEVEAAAAAPHV